MIELKKVHLRILNLNSKYGKCLIDGVEGHHKAANMLITFLEVAHGQLGDEVSGENVDGVIKRAYTKGFKILFCEKSGHCESVLYKGLWVKPSFM